MGHIFLKSWQRIWHKLLEIYQGSWKNELGRCLTILQSWLRRKFFITSTYWNCILYYYFSFSYEEFFIDKNLKGAHLIEIKSDTDNEALKSYLADPDVWEDPVDNWGDDLWMNLRDMDGSLRVQKIRVDELN